MTDSRDSDKPAVIVGLLRLRDHCTFSWEEPQSGGRRTAWVRATHCADCVSELERRGYEIARVAASE
jgi:hypothetical protein